MTTFRRIRSAAIGCCALAANACFFSLADVAPIVPAPTRLGIGQSTSCALVGTEVRCWGSNDAGQLGIGSADTMPHPMAVRVAGLGSIAAVAMGGKHACALDEGGA